MVEIKDNTAFEILCPYCGTNNISPFNDQSFNILYIHIPDSHDLNSNSDSNKILRKKCKNNNIQKEIIVSCSNPDCNKEFHIEYIKIESNKKNTCYIDLLNNDVKLEVKSLLENVLDSYFNILNKSVYKGFKLRPQDNFKDNIIYQFIGCFIFFFLLSLIYIIPIFINNKLALIDNMLFGMLFLIDVFILLLLRIQLKEIRDIIDGDLLPFDLNKKYLKSRYYKIYKELTLKEMFGKINRFSSATVIGAIFASLILLFILNSIWLNKLDIINLSVDIFYMITFFIFGNAFFYAIKTNRLVCIIAGKIPFKISAYRNNEYEKLGKLIFRSYFIIGLVIGFILYIFASYYLIISLTTIDISSINKDVIFSSIINYIIDFSIGFFISPISKIGQLAIPLLYLIIVIYVLVQPILIIHHKIKSQKQKMLDEVNNKIVNYKEQRNFIDDLHDIRLINEHEKIKSINEWPFKTDLLNMIWNVSTVAIIPIIGILLTSFI